MNKNIIIGILVIVVIAAAGIGGYVLLNSDKPTKPEKTETNNPTGNGSTTTDNNKQYEKNDNDNNNTTTNGKTLVVYYSATGSTKNVAEEIAKNLNADLFEIEPVNVYTSADLDWTNNDSRVSKEHNDESLRDVSLKTTKVDNWESYDRVLIGYPIWWGIAAWPVNTFVKNNNFTGKTVIPFCTSASSGLGESGKLLAEYANTGNWMEGYRFSSGASSSQIKTFTDNIKRL